MSVTAEDNQPVIATERLGLAEAALRYGQLALAVIPELARRAPAWPIEPFLENGTEISYQNDTPAVHRIDARLLAMEERYGVSFVAGKFLPIKIVRHT